MDFLNLVFSLLYLLELIHPKRKTIWRLFHLSFQLLLETFLALSVIYPFTPNLVSEKQCFFYVKNVRYCAILIKIGIFNPKFILIPKIPNFVNIRQIVL